MSDTTSAELHEERDFLLRSLEDLEHEWAAGDIDEADYRALKDDYTTRAAAVLRTLDERGGTGDADGSGVTGGAGPPVAVAPVAVRHRRRRWRAVAAAAGIVALGVVAGEALARYSGERLDGEPSSGTAAAPGAGGELAEARRLFRSGELLDAVKLYDRVLAREPRNAEALAYRGWIVHLAGLTDEGLGYLDRAVEADPDYALSRWFKGLILLEAKRDPAAAVPEIEAFIAAGPPPAMLAPAREVLRAAQDAARTGTAPSSSVPAGTGPPARK